MNDKNEVKQHEINEVLSVIANELVGQFDMSKLLDQVVNTSMKTLNAEVCSIFLEDKEYDPGYITMRAGSGFAEPLVGKAKYRIGDGFTGYVAKFGKKFNIKTRQELESLKINNRKIWRGKHDGTQWPSGTSEFRNLVALPLRIKNQILGVIKVENKDKKLGPYFSEDDERYFETIANVVALAIENARLHEKVEKQLKAIAAKASHRIGNQVANYDGIELDLLDEIDKPIADKQALEEVKKRVHSTTKDLKRMIEEFQTYGKPLKLDKQETNINKIIDDEAWIAHPPTNIVINKKFDPNIPNICIDPGRFGEACKELFRNSIKAIKECHQKKGEILVITKSDSIRGVIVIFEDDIPGFPPNFPVFEPFMAKSQDSTGLGLATVKELIEAHGGKIKTSTPKELTGACIELNIPLNK